MVRKERKQAHSSPISVFLSTSSVSCKESIHQTDDWTIYLLHLFIIYCIRIISDGVTGISFPPERPYNLCPRRGGVPSSRDPILRVQRLRRHKQKPESCWGWPGRLGAQPSSRIQPSLPSISLHSQTWTLGRGEEPLLIYSGTSSRLEQCPQLHVEKMTLGLGLKQRSLCTLAQARSSQTADEWSLAGNVDPRSALPFLGLCNDGVGAKGRG